MTTNELHVVAGGNILQRLREVSEARPPRFGPNLGQTGKEDIVKPYGMDR